MLIAQLETVGDGQALKKGLTRCAIKPFRCLVAGIGFEPMTFGL